MTTITWQIDQMKRLTVDGFVVWVNYSAIAVDGDVSASVVGIVEYTQKAGETYIPYDQLTEQIVIGWVQTTLSDEGRDVDAELQVMIDAKKAPVVASGMPWYVPPTPTPLA